MKRFLLTGLVLVMVGCGKDKPEFTVPVLIETLKDQDPAMRSYAAKSLGKFGPEARDAVPNLTEALKDQDRNVRIGAAYALAQIGPEAKKAIPALKQALKDSDPKVREGAAQALKQLQPASSKSPKRGQSTKPQRSSRKSPREVSE